MNRKALHRSLPIATALLLSATLAHGWWQAGAGMRAQPVAGKVQWIEGTQGGNIGLLVGDEGTLVVDTYIAGARDALSAAVQAAAKGGVRLVVNTHWHGDHTGNNLVWGGTATILAHENVRRRLVGDATLGGRTAEQSEAGSLPIVTFEDGLGLHLAGEDVRIRHFAAAHTDGDSVVVFEGSKVVHMGDLFFNKRFPFIDLDSGGGVRGVITAVEAILPELDAEWTIIPGHGPLAKKADLEGYLAMLRETSGLVAEAIEARKTLAELKQEDPLVAWKDWSWAFIDSERYLEILFESLTRAR